MTSSRDPVWDTVRYAFSRDAWYAVMSVDGNTYHSPSGWQTEWAADRYVHYWMQQWYGDKVKRGQIGDGDVCPLFPHHGQMFTLTPAPGKAPQQYCPNVAHDGLTYGPNAMPRSRSIWPLHGFNDSVATYMARLDHAIAQAGLPDLSDLEVR